MLFEGYELFTPKLKQNEKCEVIVITTFLVLVQSFDVKPVETHDQRYILRQVKAKAKV
jgi:hypothetical protein